MSLMYTKAMIHGRTKMHIIFLGVLDITRTSDV